MVGVFIFFYKASICHTIIRKAGVCMDKTYDLYIVGMNIEPFKRKTYSGFGGDFAEKNEQGNKYFLYFKTYYGQKYSVLLYSYQEINNASWLPATKCHIGIKQLKNFPHMKYIYKSACPEYLNLNEKRDSVFITTPYFDFSKYGKDKSNPNGYVIINMDFFEETVNMSNEDICKKINSMDDMIKKIYNEKSKEEENDSAKFIVDNILSEESTVEWNYQCMIRHRGISGSGTSNEQLSK